MPCTPWRRTSSATWKASIIVVFVARTERSFSFGTTISVSTSEREGVHPIVRLRGTARALEAERLGDDADRERADVTREASDDRCGTGARASAGARGHEDHVRALEEALDLVLLLEGGAVAELGIRARAQAAAGACAQVHGHVRQRLLERLKVGVDRHELDAGDAGLDHAVDRVHAGAADADHADHGRVRAGVLVAARVVGLLAAVYGPRGLSVLGKDPGQALLGAGRSRALGDRVVVLDVEDRRSGGRRALGLTRRGLVLGLGLACLGLGHGRHRAGLFLALTLVMARRQRGRLGRILREPQSSGKGPRVAPPSCLPSYVAPWLKTSLASSR